MRTSIYLPDALAEQVKKYDISISEETQTALRKAVERAQKKEQIMSDIDTVVERLRSTVDEADREKREEGRADGVTWAKRHATASELETIAGENPEGQWDGDTTLADFMSRKDNRAYTRIGVDLSEPYWEGFTEGAEEIWNAVADKL